jgi:hypothetical protein
VVVRYAVIVTSATTDPRLNTPTITSIGILRSVPNHAKPIAPGMPLMAK